MSVTEFGPWQRKLALREGMVFPALVALDEALRAVGRTAILSRLKASVVELGNQVNELLHARRRWAGGAGNAGAA